jgi:hypothetical protein
MYITVFTDFGLFETTFPAIVKRPLVVDPGGLVNVNVGAVPIKFPDRTRYARVTIPPTGNLIPKNVTIHSFFPEREFQSLQCVGKRGKPPSVRPRLQVVHTVISGYTVII